MQGGGGGGGECRYAFNSINAETLFSSGLVECVLPAAIFSLQHGETMRVIYRMRGESA